MKKHSDNDLTTINQTEISISITPPRISELSVRSLRRPELTEMDHKEIKSQLRECKKNIKPSLLAPEDSEGTIFPLISCSLLILFIIYSCRVAIIGELSSLVLSIYEQKEWQSEPEKFLKDITNLNDMDSYMVKVLLPQSFSTSYLQSFNYICGIRFSLQLSRLVENPISDYNAVKYIRDSHASSQKSMRLWDYSSSFTDQGAYTEYFINLSKEEALLQWEMMKPLWLDEEIFSSLAVEFIIHNTNLYSTLYYYQVFTHQGSGRITVETGSSGINPEMYSSQNEGFVAVISILSVYFIVFLIQLSKCVKKTQSLAKEMLKKWKNVMNIYDGLNILLIVLILTIIILFSVYDLNNIGKITLPVDKQAFDTLVEYAVNYRVLLRLASVTCFLSMIKLTASLRTQFPSFGVLFDTINYSKSDLINILFIVVILLMGFIIATQLEIGSHEFSFSRFSRTLIRLFSCLVGILDLNPEGPQVSIYKSGILICYILLFSFVLIRMLAAIVMSTFLFIKNRDQLLLAARANLLKDTTVSLIKLLMNIVLLKDNSSLYQDAQEYDRLRKKSLSKNTLDDPIVVEKLKMLENSIKQLNKKSHLMTIKQNIINLTLFLKESVFENREVVTQNIKRKIKELLLQERIDEIRSRNRELDVDYNFTLIKEMILYGLLLIFFSYTFILQIDIQTIFQLQNMSTSSVYLPTFTSVSTLSLSQIHSYDSLYNYLDQVLFGFMDHLPYENNYLYMDKSIRFTVRRYNLDKNDLEFSQSVIPKIISSGSNQTSYRGPKSRLLYRYFPKGSTSTFHRRGGIPVELKSNSFNKLLVEVLRGDDLFNIECEYLASEWIVYNGNTDYFIYNTLVFYQSRAGFISSKFKSVAIGPEFHTGTTLKFIILNAVIFIICSYFTVRVFKELTMKWMRRNRLRLEENSIKHQVKIVIDEICRDQLTTPNFWKTTSMCCTSLLTNLVQHIMQLILVIYKYFTKNFIRMIETVSFVLMYVSVFTSIGFTVDPIEVSTFDDFYIGANRIENYKWVLAFTFFFLFFRLPKYFLLSSKLAFLIKIISKSSLDILFFMLMFFTMIFAFTISGYIMLGHFHPGYSNLRIAFISTYLMKFGVFDYDRYYLADPILGIIYIILFVVIMIFFLSTMFMAIISGYYRTLSKKYTSQVGMIEKIFKTIRAKFRQESVLTTDRDYSMPDLEGTNKISDNLNQTGNSNMIIETITSFVVNPYFKEAEEMLQINGNLDLTRFQVREYFIYDHEVVEFQEIAFLNKEQWLSEPISARAKIWNTLSCSHRHETLLRKTNSFVSGVIQASTFQSELWHTSSLLEQIQLWTKKLSPISRANAWTLIPYPGDMVKNWPDFGSSQKLEATKDFFNGFSSFSRRLKNSKDLEKFLAELNVCEKAKFWLALKGYQEAKVEMFLNLGNEVEAEILAYFMIFEAVEQVIVLEDYDIYMERLLEHAIYMKVEALSWWRIEKNNVDKLDREIAGVDYECNILAEYRENLINEVDDEKNANEHLKRSKRIRRS